MQREHRGHIIRFVQGASLRAELVEATTGALLPTAVTATAGESHEALAARARALIDLYLAALVEADRRDLRLAGRRAA